MFDTEFYEILTYMNSTWLKFFEVTPGEGEAKVAITESGSDTSNFGPLSLCFKHRILDNKIATT